MTVRVGDMKLIRTRLNPPANAKDRTPGTWELYDLKADPKEATNLALQGPHRANLEAEARLFAMAFSSEDQKEGMAAFVEKRPPEFRGR